VSALNGSLVTTKMEGSSNLIQAYLVQLRYLRPLNSAQGAEYSFCAMTGEVVRGTVQAAHAAAIELEP